MNFGEALEAIKQGKGAYRKVWNKDGEVFIFLRPEDIIPEDIVINVVKSLPNVVKNYIKDNPNTEGKIKFTNYICLKGTTNSIINGWVPNHYDMLAEDWEIIEE